jgi:photosystem II stability/assembly factor-like uncharacterized protein
VKNFRILASIAAVWVTVDSVYAQIWTQASVPTNNWYSAVAASADGSKWVTVTVGDSFYTSGDSGNTWVSNNVPANNWTSVASSADGSKLVATAYGTGINGIYTSSDSGSTWVFHSVPPNRWASVASSADGNKLVAVEHVNPNICFSTNAGITWISTSVPNLQHWNSGVALSADGSKLLCAGLYWPFFLLSPTNGILVSTNLGVQWDFKEGQRFVSLACSSDGTKLVAATGLIWLSQDSGATWTQTGLPNASWPSIASSADGTKLVAVTYGSGIYTSTDSGNTWISNNVPTNSWRSVATSADGGKLAAVTDSGGIWTLQTTPIPQMTLTPGNGNLTLSWIIPSTNFVLQQNLDLTISNWTDVTNIPVLDLMNLQNEVTLPATNGSAFYRLATQ